VIAVPREPRAKDAPLRRATPRVAIEVAASSDADTGECPREGDGADHTSSSVRQGDPAVTSAVPRNADDNGTIRAGRGAAPKSFNGAALSTLADFLESRESRG